MVNLTFLSPVTLLLFQARTDPEDQNLPSTRANANPNTEFNSSLVSLIYHPWRKERNDWLSFLVVQLIIHDCLANLSRYGFFFTVECDMDICMVPSFFT